MPEPVLDFMHMHHGNGLLEYFWHKNEQLGNPKRLSEKAFRYPGLPPQTKETAILAICDAVEAASRTLKTPTERDLTSLVQRIVFGKLRLGQLDQSGLTSSDSEGAVQLARRHAEELVPRAHRVSVAEGRARRRPAGTSGGAAAAAAAATRDGDGGRERRRRSRRDRAGPSRRASRSGCSSKSGSIRPTSRGRIPTRAKPSRREARRRLGLEEAGAGVLVARLGAAEAEADHLIGA